MNDARDAVEGQKMPREREKEKERAREKEKGVKNYCVCV